MKRPYDTESAKRDVDNLASIWDAESFARISGIGALTVSPVFIVGMPRSGSTLLDQILCAHPKLCGVGEDSIVAEHFPVWIAPKADEIQNASRLGSEALRNFADSGQNVVDKYLNNFLRIGALAAAFPNAKFLETARDPRSIALSIYSNAMQVDGHPYSTDLGNIADYFLNYEKLMAHWHSVLGDRVRRVEYETLVDNPEPEIREIVSWLGLPWHDDCLKPNAVARRVKTISYTQVRSEISTKSVDRWRRFEDTLKPFIEKLEQAGRL